MISPQTRPFAVLALAALLIGAFLSAPRLFRAWLESKSIRQATEYAINEGTTLADAVRGYQSDKGAYPDDLERDLVPKYATEVVGNWYLNREGAAPRLSLHSNLPEWLLQFDFASRAWTIELIGRTVDITSDVSRARRSP